MLHQHPRRDAVGERCAAGGQISPDRSVEVEAPGGDFLHRDGRGHLFRHRCPAPDLAQPVPLAACRIDRPERAVIDDGIATSDHHRTGQSRCIEHSRDARRVDGGDRYLQGRRGPRLRHHRRYGRPTWYRLRRQCHCGQGQHDSS